ncbi:nSTAND1 domain-containing NTPase [Streptomyces sp. URMC 127]|uniref:nSTAND1 domain-containing NTPase n=1 Tax=Streptomyces sp. URMC 127 TaxID=3423402 RepID=UPI003F19B595
MSSGMGGDAAPEPGAREGTRESLRQEAHASEGATVVMAGGNVFITYTNGVRQRQRTEPGAPMPQCPYPGLAAFGPDHERWFFGRDRLVTELILRLDQRLRTGGMQMVVAPSGAGKTSLLRAGLLPRLDQGALEDSDHWPKLVLTPTAEPMRALARGIAALTGGRAAEVAAALAADPVQVLTKLARQYRGRSRVVLVVDQFEELFTLCSDERQRRAFVEVLARVTDGPDSVTRVEDGRDSVNRSADGRDSSAAGAGTGGPPVALVVLGLRADFYAGCVDHPPLRAALEDSPLVVGPMSETELREAIRYPAQDVGLDIEPGLEELLLYELGTPWPAPADGSGGHEAGRLPLLAHALRACWQQRSGRTLTVQGYQDTGGIRNAVATTANDAYRALDETDRLAARSVFLRLVRIGDETEDTRRRVPRTELIRSSADGGQAARVLEAFMKARLLTTQLDSVEITHESLLHSWPLLRDWIDEDRAGRLVHQHLEDAAEAWRRSGHDPSLLYGGSRLEAAESWAAGAPPGEPGPTARDFLSAATRARRRGARVRAGITAVLAVLALLATVGAVAAFQQRGTARSQQHEAERQRDLVLYNQVLATADRLRSTDVSLAAQFTLIAHRLHPSGDTYSRLVTAGNAPLSMPVAAHRAGICGLAASPDGRTLATGSDDYTVRLWDVTDATRPKALGEPLAGFGSAVCALAFSPDGRTLATGGFDRTVRLWNVAEPARPKPLGSPLPGYDKSAGSVRAVAFSPDGRTLATGSYPSSGVAPVTDPGLRLWDVSDPTGPRLLSQAAEGAEFVDRLAFTPDGRGLVTSPAAKSFRMWDLADLKHPKALDAAPAGHSEAVSALAMSPDGKTVVTGSRDQTLRVWDVSDPGRVKALGSRPVTGLTRGVESLAFSRDGRTLAAGCGDLTIRLWNLSDRTSPAALGPPLAGHTNGIQALAFTPDGRTLVAGDKGRTMRLWSLPARPLTGRTLGYSVPDLTYALAFSPNGHTLASGHFDKSVQWWNVTAPERPASLGPPSSVHTDRVCAVEFSPGGRTAATGSGDRTVLLWDVSDPKRPKALKRLTGHDSDVCALGFSPDGRTLATGSREPGGGSGKGSLRLWDVSAPDRPAPLGQPLIDLTGGITALAFSPDGHTLAASGGDSRVRLWDVSERSQAAPLGDPLSDHTSTVGGLAFSPDGRLLASSGADAVRLRDVSDPKRPRALATLTGDQGPADNVVFSPDGRTVAVSEDKAIRLWDVSDPRRAVSRGEPLDGHTGGISALAFSPDGRTLASAGSDQVIRLWNMDPGQDIKRICAVTRNSPAADAWRRHVSTAIAFPAPC